MLATLRSDGYPRISPMEPRLFEGELWLVGMPHTTKFADLARDPRFSLHTATVDTHVGDGDAKLWGTVHDVPGQVTATALGRSVVRRVRLRSARTDFDTFYAADIIGASWSR